MSKKNHNPSLSADYNEGDGLQHLTDRQHEAIDQLESLLYWGDTPMYEHQVTADCNESQEYRGDEFPIDFDDWLF